MAQKFTPLNEYDTVELRKELNLPVTKELRYMEHVRENAYIEKSVVNFEVVDLYMPSDTASILVTLENGEKVRILEPFFAHMQKSTFVSDMAKEETA